MHWWDPDNIYESKADFLIIYVCKKCIMWYQESATVAFLASIVYLQDIKISITFCYILDHYKALANGLHKLLTAAKCCTIFTS